MYDRIVSTYSISPATAETIELIVRQALAEDLGDGDVTTNCTIPPGHTLHGEFIAKQGGVAAGLAVAGLAFTLLDPAPRFVPLAAEGARVAPGQLLATVDGPGGALLSAERTALNFLQRLSGIATLTRQFVDAAAGTRAVILDTRKTAPGLRVLDKLAVRLGGGQNHRFGLFDMVLIKDNHIAAVGGRLSEAVRRVRAGDARHRPIEVEVTNLDELREALALDVDRILLDNMSLEDMRAAVLIAAGRAPLEASGNMSLDRAAAVAATGVDFISVGALTHSVRALDISLEIRRES
jgi:nicotinate-nucleotide pyrophosphorylase (carboxylating)